MLVDGSWMAPNWVPCMAPAADQIRLGQPALDFPHRILCIFSSLF